MQEKVSSNIIVAIIPVYNNAQTLQDVLVQVTRYIPNIIVINDGSTDNFPTLVKSKPEIGLIDFPKNRGKGSALKAGFKKALDLGFSHALTIDADGQHLPEDIPIFLQKQKESPDTLWIGNRSIPTNATEQPVRSRFGRSFGAFWYRFHTGNKIDDTQCGFRMYPLDLIKDLQCAGKRYEFEIEILIKAAWNGVNVEQVPIHLFYHPKKDTVSHFRPIKDFLRISLINSKASLIRILLPWRTIHAPGKSAREKLVSLVKSELKAHSTPKRAAASLALGVFMSLFPIHGFQVVTCMALTFLFKLNRALAFLGVSLSSPPMLPFLIALAIGIGKLVVPPDIIQFSTNSKAATFLQYGLEWFVGSIILSIAAGILTYILAYPAFVKLRQARRQMKANRI